MGTLVNASADVTGMTLRVPRGRHDPDPATFTASLRTPQHAPDMRSGPRLCYHPACPLGVTDRFANVLVWVVGHFRGFPSAM